MWHEEQINVPAMARAFMDGKDGIWSRMRKAIAETRWEYNGMAADDFFELNACRRESDGKLFLPEFCLHMHTQRALPRDIIT